MCIRDRCWGGGVARLLSTYPQAQLLGLSATKVRYLDGQRDMAEELFAGCVASEMSLGEAIVRGILPSPTYVTTVYQIQRALDGIQKRVDAISPVVLRRDGQRHMDALREAVQNAEGLPSIFARYITAVSYTHLDVYKRQYRYSTASSAARYFILTGRIINRRTSSSGYIAA